MLDIITEGEKEISKHKLQIAVMQTDLIALRTEQVTWAGRVEAINKAREEMKNQYYEQEWELKHINNKIKDKDDQIKNITKKLYDVEIQYHDVSKKLH